MEKRLAGDWGESKVTAFEIVAKRRLKVIPTSATLENFEPALGSLMLFSRMQSS